MIRIRHQRLQEEICRACYFREREKQEIVTVGMWLRGPSTPFLVPQLKLIRMQLHENWTFPEFKCDQCLYRAQAL